MPVVWIPSLMQDLTGGAEHVTVPGSTVRQVVTALEQRYPGFRDRLIQDDRLVPFIAAFIDGRESEMGLAESVGENSEVTFLPAISGGLS